MLRKPREIVQNSPTGDKKFFDSVISSKTQNPNKVTTRVELKLFKKKGGEEKANQNQKITWNSLIES